MQLPFRWPSPPPPSPDSRPRLQSQGALAPAGTTLRRGHGAWLLSRALYRCRPVPLAHVGAADRRAVLHNLLLAWAPFDRPAYRVAWQGTDALAFAWDEAATRSMLAAAGAPDRAELLPESMLRDPPTSDGLRVLAGLEGFDAQVWRNGALVATRWWPQAPDTDEARLWLRTLGSLTESIDTLPPVSPAGWRRRPWAELQTPDELRSTSTRMERIAIGAALVGFAGLAAVQARQSWAAYDEYQSVRAELDRQRLEAAPVLAARDRAEAMARDVQALSEPLTGVMPLELMQFLADVLPPAGVTLKELELAGRKLRLAFELRPDIQRSALVKDLQTGGWFTKVVEVRGSGTPGWVQFEAELAGTQAPVVPPRATVEPAAPARASATPAFPAGMTPPPPAAAPAALPRPARAAGTGT